MRILDVGCGPGAITLGLAEAVAPGETFGIDAQSTQVAAAQRLLEARGVTNAAFAMADAYSLPFPDESFDAVFAHAVLMHLREPLRGLAEVRRVLRRGGVIGARDPDLGVTIRVPETSLMSSLRALTLRVLQHNGGDPTVARHHRRLMLEAGFSRTEGSATTIAYGSEGACREFAGFLKAQFVNTRETALTQGWSDENSLDAISAEIDRWAEEPAAFGAVTFCETIGWRES
jgi:ubiquinone/menaquinone biosynthesis C-methylase UbiE